MFAPNHLSITKELGKAIKSLNTLVVKERKMKIIN